MSLASVHPRYSSPAVSLYQSSDSIRCWTQNMCSGHQNRHLQSSHHGPHFENISDKVREASSRPGWRRARPAAGGTARRPAAWAGAAGGAAWTATVGSPSDSRRANPCHKSRLSSWANPWSEKSRVEVTLVLKL